MVEVLRRHRVLGEQGQVLLARREGTDGPVRPQRRGRVREGAQQVLAVTVGVEALEAAGAALEGALLGDRPRRPAGKGLADGLAVLVDALRGAHGGILAQPLWAPSARINP